MGKESIRALSGVALGVVIAIGLWSAFSVGERSRIEGALRHAAAEASVQIQRRLSALDLAGASARDALARGGDFTALADGFEAGAATSSISGPPLRLIGVAELRRAQTGWTPRGARLTEDAAPEELAALGREAEALRIEAQRAAERAPTAPVELDPVLVRAAGDAPRVWIIWRDDAAGAAFAALVALPESAEALGVDDYADVRFGALSLLPSDAPALPALSADEDRLSARVAVSLAGATAVLPVHARAPGFFSMDRRVTGPMSVFAALIFGALFILARAQRLRDETIARRQRAIIESIAAKQTELDESEARFRHLAESTNVIPWRADVDHNRFTYVGPQIEDLTGIPASTWRAEGFWLQHVYAKDRQKVRLQTAEKARDGGYFTLEYRIRDAQGEILHINNMMSITRHPREDGGQSLVAQGFMLDVTDRIRAAEELQRAHAAAERANKFKSAFLATMSHELRTPLNAVIGFSEIMKDELFGPLDPQYRDYAVSVHASGKHLLNLINDILDLSKIEAGRFELHEEPSEIPALLDDCRALMQERIDAAGLTASLDLDPAAQMVLIDERRIKQVILNLLSNAIKFTPEGGDIRLVAKRSPGAGLSISVRDSGIGMAPDEIPRALESFGQIDGELSRRHDGTGLGLPIARSLTQLHGGEFEIRSEKGVGTEIFIHLPESRVLTGPAAVAE